MKPFFQDRFERLVESPNQSQFWWHSLPLPTGDRINGYNQDKDLQFKQWRAMQIADKDGLAGKRVLDIGANDGFFTVAAIMAAGLRLAWVLPWALAFMIFGSATTSFSFLGCCII
jgi:hypothetical protein